MIADVKKPDKWVFWTSGYCSVGCGLYIGVKDGKAVYTKGNPKHDVNMGILCPKGLSLCKSFSTVQTHSKATW